MSAKLSKSQKKLLEELGKKEGIDIIFSQNGIVRHYFQGSLIREITEEQILAWLEKPNRKTP